MKTGTNIIFTMAYSKKNYYKKIVKIQEITQNQIDVNGYSYKQIFHQFIEHQFNISMRTFQNYLGIPAKRELKKLEQTTIKN